MKTVKYFEIFIFIAVIILSVNAFSQEDLKKITVSGYVTEAGSKEQLVGINVFSPDLHLGTLTNSFGFYSLSIKGRDSIQLIFNSLGYQSKEVKLLPDKNIELNIDLIPDEGKLKEVVIESGYRGEANNPQISTISLSSAEIKKIPALLGEKDVLKVLQLMPGVQKGNEGNVGLYVRGGGPDQNLIILDDAIIYNPYHLFGFLSLFNGDALRSVELIKGGFPARYGGRLSSVLELNMKEGNKEKIKGEVGVGLVSAKATVEGPIIKNKASFLVSARRTYIDALAAPFMTKGRKLGYYFYDLNSKINYDFGRRNKVYLSSYFGRDKFASRLEEYNSANELSWRNSIVSLRWNHLFSSKLFANTSLVFSQYNMHSFNKAIDTTKGGESWNQRYSSFIRDLTLKSDLEFILSPALSIKTGFSSIFHTFNPWAFVSLDPKEPIETGRARIKSYESGVYLETIFKPMASLTINSGIRFSHYFCKGKSYFFPEPRISSAFKLRENLALKAAFSLMNQYTHMLTNATIGLPTDLWVPATDRTLPQRAKQVAAGIAQDFPSKKISVTVEGFYKENRNILGYKGGANYIGMEGHSENNWEDKVISGKGWSYGTEFLLRKSSGKFSGWIGYTLSWTWLQFDQLNQGKKFFARYDRRHDASIVGIYKVNDKITISATWVFGTGNALTMPLGIYSLIGELSRGRRHTVFSEKNILRMPSYHRADIGIQFKKILKWGGERQWETGVYNVYNRFNPFYYFVAVKPVNKYPVFSLKQITLFPILPYVSYSLKF